MREERGLTRKQLAEATGIPVRSIAAYERGVVPPVARAAVIALQLDVTLEDIAVALRVKS